MIWVLYIYKNGKLHDVMSPSRDDLDCQLYVLLGCTKQYKGKAFSWRIRAESVDINAADITR